MSIPTLCPETSQTLVTHIGVQQGRDSSLLGFQCPSMEVSTSYMDLRYLSGWERIRCEVWEEVTGPDWCRETHIRRFGYESWELWKNQNNGSFEDISMTDPAAKCIKVLPGGFVKFLSTVVYLHPNFSVVSGTIQRF